jgi:hypothetical protein
MLGHDLIRLTTCLGHVVPGVTIELICSNDEHLIVASHRLDAHFTPCELRSAVLADRQPGVPRFADVVTSFSITAGMNHLGGGLYERRCEDRDERWFATTLTHPEVDEVFGSSPFELPDNAVDARLMPDSQLGATAVCVVSDSDHSARLDEISSWALAGCMVAELIADLRQKPINIRNRP